MKSWLIFLVNLKIVTYCFEFGLLSMYLQHVLYAMYTCFEFYVLVYQLPLAHIPYTRGLSFMYCSVVDLDRHYCILCIHELSFFCIKL